MPKESVDSINRTRTFLRSLLDPKKTPKVPKAIREEASGCLRHYPFEFYEDAILDALEKGFKL
jgi:hypothetical protein